MQCPRASGSRTKITKVEWIPRKCGAFKEHHKGTSQELQTPNPAFISVEEQRGGSTQVRSFPDRDAGQEPLGMPLYPAMSLEGREEANSGTATTTAATARSWETSSSKLTSRGQDKLRIRQESDRNIRHCKSTQTRQVGKVLGAPKQHRYFTKGTPQGLQAPGTECSGKHYQ